MNGLLVDFALGVTANFLTLHSFVYLSEALSGICLCTFWAALQSPHMLAEDHSSAVRQHNMIQLNDFYFHTFSIIQLYTGWGKTTRYFVLIL